MNELCHSYERMMPHIWMSYVTHMNESCRTYDWVMSHIWTSHVTHMNESWRMMSQFYTHRYTCKHVPSAPVWTCYTYECVMPQTWIRHVTDANKSRHSMMSFTWALCPWMSHVAHIDGSCLTHKQIKIWIQIMTSRDRRLDTWISRWMSHVAHMDESCRTYRWVMSEYGEEPHHWLGERSHISDWKRHISNWERGATSVTGREEPHQWLGERGERSQTSGISKEYWEGTHKWLPCKWCMSYLYTCVCNKIHT